MGHARTGWAAAVVLAAGLGASLTHADDSTPAAAAKPAEPHFAVPFIENDYSKALAEARSRKLPLFVEAWTPW